MCRRTLSTLGVTITGISANDQLTKTQSHTRAYVHACRYLVTQQVVEPGMTCTAITSVLCPFYNWLLIYRLNLGLQGAAYAYVLSNATFTFLLAGYTGGCVDSK